MKKWQKILGLENWDIKVEIVELGTLTGYDEDTWLAESSWDFEAQTAHIQLTEKTESKLLHELVHIVFDSTDTLGHYLPAEAKLAHVVVEDLAVQRVAQILYKAFGKKGE